MLEKLPPQPICETEVIAELKENSRIVQNANWLEKIGFSGLITAGGSGLFDFGSDIDFIIMITNKL